MTSQSLSRFNEEVSIVLCGEAGQGIQTVEHILTQTLKLSGYHVFSTKEYMSRIRGGSDSTLIRVSSNRVSAPVDRIDLLIPFSPGAVRHVQKKISSKTVLLGEKKIYGNEYQGERAIDVRFAEIASEIGGPIYFKGAGLECSTCHEYFSTREHSGLPSLAVCETCHAEPQTKSAEEETLRTLIASSPQPVFRKLFRLPDHVYYSHRRHVAVAGLQCETCHGAIAETTAPPARALVRITMDTCIGCHTEKHVKNDCTNCHQ